MEARRIHDPEPQPASSRVIGEVGWEHIPAAVRDASGITAPSYADRFRIGVGERREASAEAWARIILEGTPTGQSAPRLWRLLGLRLGPTGSPDHVQGWEIAHREGHWVRLATASWAMSARAVVWLDDAEVSLALFVRVDRLPAAVIWPPVAVLHRRAVPVMLRQAVAAPTGRD
jgi:hypothetical protein